MKTFFLLLFCAFIFFILWAVYRKAQQAKRARFIDGFEFPKSIADKVSVKYPHLDSAGITLVMDGLREYFHICNIAGRNMVSMPSQAVDTAWHEFILFTRQYEQFCRKSFGRFLHHTPAEAMRAPTDAQKGIKVAWRIACHREHILPKSPHKLPLLFALDAKLNIDDGFKYSLNCTKSKNHPYCASHIGCNAGCASSCSSDSSGCSSGCGGGD